MTIIRKSIYYILFPFIVVWMALAVCIYSIGKALQWLGDAMSGFRIDESMGNVYVE